MKFRVQDLEPHSEFSPRISSYPMPNSRVDRFKSWRYRSVRIDDGQQRLSGGVGFSFDESKISAFDTSKKTWVPNLEKDSCITKIAFS